MEEKGGASEKAMGMAEMVAETAVDPGAWAARVGKVAAVEMAGEAAVAAAAKGAALAVEELVKATKA